MIGRKKTLLSDQEIETNGTTAKKDLSMTDLSNMQLNHKMANLILDPSALDRQLSNKENMLDGEAALSEIDSLLKEFEPKNSRDQSDDTLSSASQSFNYVKSITSQSSPLSEMDKENYHCYAQSDSKLNHMPPHLDAFKENKDLENTENDSMDTQFDGITSCLEEPKQESDLMLPIELKLSDIKSDFSEFSSSAILFFYITDIQSHSVVFAPNSMCLTFKTNYNILDNLDKSKTEFSYVLKLNFKNPIQEKESNAIQKKMSMEIRLRKREPIKWGSLREACSEQVIPQTSSQQTEINQDTWTPCTPQSSQVAPSNLQLALVPYQNHVPYKQDPYQHNQHIEPTSSNKQFYGYTGLVNMGNTCFMNSVLQCLANTNSLKQYFLSGHYLNDINEKNPLGTKGECAKAFAHFLNQLWIGKQSSFTPHKIKDHIADKVATFSGYAQHDAQEFMSYLLDVIHEDLNNNHNRLQAPKIEDEETLFTRDSTDCKYESELANINYRLMELSHKMWQRYRLYNNSIIIDQFCGQLKSVLTCPDCHKKSITFDPFLFVPLPIPPPKLIYHVIYFTCDEESGFCKGSYRFSLKPLQKATVGDLVKQVQNHLGRLSLKCRVVQQQDDLVVKFLNLNWLLSDYQSKQNNENFPISKERPLLLFEIPPATKHARIELCIIQRKKWNSFELNNEQVGFPFVISIKKSMLCYSHLCAVLCSYARHSVVAYQPSTKGVDVFRSAQFTYENYLKSLTSHTSATNCFNDSQPAGIPHLIYLKSRDTDFGVTESDMKAPFLIYEPNFNGSDEKELKPAKVLVGSVSRSASCSGDGSGSENSNESVHHTESSVSSNQEDEDIFIYDNDLLLDLNQNTFYLTLDWITVQHFPNVEFAVHLGRNHRWDNYENISEEEDITLDECLSCFSDPEVLDISNQWKCPNCKGFCEASKQLSFWNLPPVLVIQLKRFKAQSGLYNHEKIISPVKYPVSGLNMSKYLGHVEKRNANCEPIYDLYGVVNHHGSVYFGHYTAYARSSNYDLGWRFFDDTTVKDVDDESDVVTSRAYLLFYKMRSS